jgi:hypothetical protein
VALVLPVLIVLLVLGVPLTLPTAALACAICAGLAELFVRRHAPQVAPEPTVEASSYASSPAGWVSRFGLAAAGAYLAIGAFAVARLPTVLDDARIWSLRGVTVAYYHGLQPEIFQSQAQSGGHPIYPLFQPVLEAVVSQAMGGPQLRFFHAELWLLLGAALWTAGYLIVRGRRPADTGALWIAPLALVAVTPAVIRNVAMGYADITGSVALAAGALAVALWLEREEIGFLGFAVLLLASAASTKNEDLVAAVLVLAVGAIAAIIPAPERTSWPLLRRRLLALGACGLWFAVLVVPWRIWTSAHHLSDSIEPPLPRALSPSYVFSRTHELREAATAMLTQTLTQWGWLAAIFISAAVVCLVTRTARRVTSFYAASVAAIVLALLWLYTTTPVSLGFLLPTSMDRTVAVFMVLAAFATAHLLATMPAPPVRAILGGLRQRQSSA